MGQVETSARLRNSRRQKAKTQFKKRRDIQNTVLGIVAAVGVIALAVAAPNTVKLLKYLPRRTHVVHSAIDRLVERGELRRTRRKGNTFLEITKAGRTRISLLTHINKPKPREWDGKWRVVIFDVPESMRDKRRLLRAMLRRIGFKYIQQSVWVYPFPCEEFIQLLKTDLAIRGRVKYLVCDSLEGDVSLGRHFKLWL